MKGMLMLPWKIKAIAEGGPDREWQTRRLSGLTGINQEPNNWEFCVAAVRTTRSTVKIGDFIFQYADGYQVAARPRYHAGEVCCIKETYSWIDGGIIYRLDNGADAEEHLRDMGIKWHSPMMMPAKYARYFIKILKVEAERVQEISFEDCLAEGVVHSKEWQELDYKAPEPLHPENQTIEEIDREISRGWDAYTKQTFIALWDSINPKFPWAMNPFVFVYTFKLIPRPEEFPKEAKQ